MKWFLSPFDLQELGDDKVLTKVSDFWDGNKRQIDSCGGRHSSHCWKWDTKKRGQAAPWSHPSVLPKSPTGTQTFHQWTLLAKTYWEQPTEEALIQLIKSQLLDAVKSSEGGKELGSRDIPTRMTSVVRP